MGIVCVYIHFVYLYMCKEKLLSQEEKEEELLDESI